MTIFAKKPYQRMSPKVAGLILLGLITALDIGIFLYAYNLGYQHGYKIGMWVFG